MGNNRIEVGISSRLNPFGLQWPKSQPGEMRPVGQQVQQALFGRAKPPILDPAQFPMLAEQLKLLDKYRRKLAQLANVDEKDYRLQLADGTIAMIDENGTIYVGAQFLKHGENNPDLLVGVLAHEIGHRPKRWHEYRQKRELAPEELQSICRHEETLADLFAGRALAEMELDCEPMVEFLQAIEKGPHPEYFDAQTRARIIRDSHTEGRYRAKQRQKLFPEFDRSTGARLHVGKF